MNIYSTGKLYKDDDLVAPPPPTLSNPPLSSEDLEHLLSEDNSNDNSKGLDALEVIRNQIVSEIKTLAEKNKKKGLYDSPKSPEMTPISPDISPQSPEPSKAEPRLLVSRPITIPLERRSEKKVEKVLKSPPKENKFDNILSSIDHIMMQKSKEKSRDRKISTDSESGVKAAAEKHEKEKKVEAKKVEVTREKPEDILAKIVAEKRSTEKRIAEEAASGFVRLADKYHRKPKIKSEDDVTPPVAKSMYLEG